MYRFFVLKDLKNKKIKYIVHLHFNIIIDYF